MFTLAAISGSELLNQLLVLVGVGLIFWLIWWGLGKIALPEPFAKIAQVVLVVAAVLFLVNFILSLLGHPIISW